MKQMITWLLSQFAAFRKWRQVQNFKRVCRKADYLQAKTFKIHLVYKEADRFVIIERQNLKLLHQRGRFKNGMNLRQVEALALYKTTI